MNYLTTNKDPEFNIRLGTIKLRKELSDNEGNFKAAAFNYNGNKKIDKYNKRPVREGYSVRVVESFEKLKQNSNSAKKQHIK